MNKEKNDTPLEKTEIPAIDAAKADKEPTEEKQLEQAIDKIKSSVREAEVRPAASMTLKKILGGDILTAGLVRSQLWLFVLIVGFTIVYVAFRYQCQQDMIAIDKLERELKDAKYKALASSSALTERCRESHVLDLLRNNKDSVLHISDQPPYIIRTGEHE